MLPWWTKTDGGFWVDANQAGYTVALVADLCWCAGAMCAQCGHGKGWTSAEFLAAFPPAATIGAIARRLRCAECGSDQGRVSFWNDTSAVAARDAVRAAAEYETFKARRRPCKET